jgi:3-hydroxyisobutyrate dehydrogenase
MADAKPLRIGVIGLGAMGNRIATRLVLERFNPTVYDVVDVAVRLFTNDVGGMMSGSPKMVGQCSDVVITVLPSTSDLREVLFGWQGLASGLARGGVLIDMGTSDPQSTVDLSKRLAEHGIDMIDAPALGTPTDAKAGKLTLIVGGDAAAVDRCQPILSTLASTIIHAGPVGSGQAGAAIGDFLRGAGILAATEALRIGQRFGLDPAAVVGIGETLGGVGPWMSGVLKSQVLSRRFASGLALGHVLKGMDVTEAVARAAGVHAPLLAACRAAYSDAQAAIGSGSDQTELLRWLESLTIGDAKQEPGRETTDAARKPIA